MPKNLHSYYKKWFRFYWDFCHKYEHPVNNKKSLSYFTNKLREKNQKEFQINQAIEAISIYYDFIQKQYQDTHQQKTIINQPINKNTNTTKKVNDQKQYYNTNLQQPTINQTTFSKPIETKNDQKQYYNNKLQQPKVNQTTFSKPIIETKKINDSSKLYNSMNNEYDQRQYKNNHKEQPKIHQTVNKNSKPIIKQPTIKHKEKETGTNWKPAYDGLHNEIKIRHYSLKTLKTYKIWLGKFQTFTKSKPIEKLSDQDIKDFLTSLAVEKNVAASTQNQAFNALLFFFRHVLKKEPGNLKDTVRAKRKPYIPVVLSKNEIYSIINNLSYPYDLIVKLLYGCGLRLFECLNLRVHCFNIESYILTIHDGKGRKDRTVPIPKSIMPEIMNQFEQIEKLHSEDLSVGYDGVFLPGQLENKYKNYSKELIWQWFFPAILLTFIPETKKQKRYHLHERHVQRAIKEGVRKAKLYKRVTAHTFRHSFASHLLQANYDIRTIQELMGHSDIRTTMIYMHTVQSQTIKERISPLDFDS